MTDVAKAHAVTAWLAHCAPSTSGAGGAWADLAGQRLAFTAAHVRERAVIRELTTILGSLDCAWVVLKGQAVAEDLYPRPDMRFGVDIDLLVPPARFGDVISALEDSGWHLVDRNWPLAARDLPAELRLRSPRGALVDLHWHLLAGRTLRARFDLPTAALLERRRLLPSGTPALNATDQILHLGLHGALAGGNRLLWLQDVTLAAAKVPDWGPVVVAAQQTRTRLALGLLLARAGRVLPGVDHQDAVARLDPAGVWRAACAVIDRRSPLVGDPNDPALARSFARSVQPGTAASLAAFLRHGAGWLGSGAGRTAQLLAIEDPNDPRSPMYVADDPAARRDYLAAIRRL